tara:strand:+ start:364 stop:624 length:261 start_codon:yes stop_codon:yes gene_type:complete
MNINELNQIILEKIKKEISFEFLDIQDNTHLHLKHKSHDKNKFHIKLIIKSTELKNISKLMSTRKIYRILKSELNLYIHSIQIELI